MVETLLQSKYHEERLAGVLLLAGFAKNKTFSVGQICHFYMEHAACVNNWDLVDVSSEPIIGPYLAELPKEQRTDFVERCIATPHLWTNRMIIIATFYDIKQGKAKSIFAIAPRFFTHPHDLIHKATGWMLREAGKRVSEEQLCEFLDTHTKNMPRTMLRYAIERLDEPKRKTYLAR